MDTRKMGIKSLSKAGCYYILFGAVFGAIFTVISLFVKFDSIIRHDLLTAIFFILSIFLFAGFYVAIRQFEDPTKMVLEFHPPKTHHRATIQEVCGNIYKAHQKRYKPIFVILIPALIAFFCFLICYSIVPLNYFIHNAINLLTNYLLLPACFSGLFAYSIWDIVYRNRMEEIQNGAYAVAEANLIEKYYCIHSCKTKQRRFVLQCNGTGGDI